VPDYKVRCEVVEILRNAFDCSKVGQAFILGPRTPEGMCARAFAGLYPTALAMRFSERIAWENEQGQVDVTCPERDVVYRLTRVRE